MSARITRHGFNTHDHSTKKLDLVSGAKGGVWSGDKRSKISPNKDPNSKPNINEILKML
jgi:hypothetical protein